MWVKHKVIPGRHNPFAKYRCNRCYGSFDRPNGDNTCPVCRSSDYINAWVEMVKELKDGQEKNHTGDQ